MHRGGSVVGAHQRLELRPNQDPHERAIHGERDLPLVDGKPLRPFIQYDAWASDGDVGLVEADDDGDAICMGGVLDPQGSGTSVRMLVDPALPLADLDRLLTKLCKWIRTEPELIVEHDPTWKLEDVSRSDAPRDGLHGGGGHR